MNARVCLNQRTMASALLAVLLFGTKELRSDGDVKSPSEEKKITATREGELLNRLATLESPEAEYEVAEVRQAAILAELATLDRAKLKDDDWAKEWAGSYYTGDGLGMNVLITVAPKSGVAYTWHGCLGLYDGNYGEIIDTFPGGIKVKLAIDPEKSDYKYMSSRLFFVRWGDHKFLVPERQMLKLVVDYNRGGMIREALLRIPVRDGAALQHPRLGPPGRPPFPAEFAKLIIEKPTRLKITGVTVTDPGTVGDEFRYIKGEVELDGGRDRGLFVGTEIDCSPKGSGGCIRLTEVGEAKSKGSFKLIVSDASDCPIEIGSEVVLPGAKPAAKDANAAE